MFSLFRKKIECSFSGSSREEHEVSNVTLTPSQSLNAAATGVDHGGGMRGMHPSYDRSGGMACTIIPPYKGDEQMKSILHNTQIITPEEIVSYIDDEIIFSRKLSNWGVDGDPET